MWYLQHLGQCLPHVRSLLDGLVDGWFVRGATRKWEFRTAEVYRVQGCGRRGIVRDESEEAGRVGVW